MAMATLSGILPARPVAALIAGLVASFLVGLTAGVAAFNLAVSVSLRAGLGVNKHGLQTKFENASRRGL